MLLPKQLIIKSPKSTFGNGLKRVEKLTWDGSKLYGVSFGVNKFLKNTHNTLIKTNNQTKP